jgi:hypothetical protein
VLLGLEIRDLSSRGRAIRPSISADPPPARFRRRYPSRRSIGRNWRDAQYGRDNRIIWICVARGEVLLELFPRIASATAERYTDKVAVAPNQTTPAHCAKMSNETPNSEGIVFRPFN